MTEQAMASIPILQWRADTAPWPAKDRIAREEPLEIRINDQPISITMRTPGHDRELAIGFLLSEGVMRTGRPQPALESGATDPDDNVICIHMDDEQALDLTRLSRHVFTSSSCGLCGKTAIRSIRQKFASVDSPIQVHAHTLLELPDRLRNAQPVFDRTGGLHAAALFDAQGKLIVLCEDVGRHNAVDKVLGKAWLEGWLPLNEHILLVSGRTSFEIIQKALAGQIPVIASISAPSSLAVQFAQDNGQTLIGFLRNQRMNIYSHAQRVVMSNV